MKLVVALEHRFIRVGNETYSSVFTYDRAWCRYLKTFSEVHVLARVASEDAVPEGKLLASAPNVHFIDLPTFIGPMQFLKLRSQVKKITAGAAELGDAFILRVPGTVGTGLWHELSKQNCPFGVEVVGDPWDVFSPKASKSMIRPFLRRYSTFNLKRQCQEAVAAAYVTREYLQKRYPTKGWSTNYSSVMLTDEAFLSLEGLAEKQQSLSRPRDANSPWILVNVGTMDQVYKRQDILIRCIATLRENGIPVNGLLVGDGRYRLDYESLAKELGVADYIEFLGRAEPGIGVRQAMDRADFFVLSSETEGLARVLMEAAARGLPIVSTDVGGCSEVVEPTELVASDSVKSLASRITALLENPNDLVELSEDNLAKARGYHRDILVGRANEFCQQLADCVIAGSKIS